MPNLVQATQNLLPDEKALCVGTREWISVQGACDRLTTVPECKAEWGPHVEVSAGFFTHANMWPCGTPKRNAFMTYSFVLSIQLTVKP